MIGTRLRSRASESFVDGAGRTITVLLAGDIVAYHGDSEVGRFRMIHVEDADQPQHFVNVAAVAADYQKAGIGINMLRIASSHWGRLTVENWADERELRLNPLLPPGRALMTKAVQLGYVWPEEPEPEFPYADYDWLSSKD